MPVEVPCGQCIGCRIDRSKQWAVRCVHEASLYERNCFITLTYNDAHLPENGSLVKKDFQDFMKRLRERFGSGVRYFHCGEYGEKLSRPHYHAILFNFDFDDRILFKIDNGSKLYVSETLDDLWQGKGFSTIGDVTFESCAYVSRYILKKITGEASEAHYGIVRLDSGEIIMRQPEYVTMSRRPGIARAWFEKYRTDVFPDDFVWLKGKKYRTPRFYDKLFDEFSHDDFVRTKFERLESMKNLKDNSIDRLEVKEECQNIRLNLLPRRIENEN